MSAFDNCSPIFNYPSEGCLNMKCFFCVEGLRSFNFRDLRESYVIPSIGT